jgi:arylsulfatase A-like enzyme
MPTCEKPNIILICVDQWRGDCLGIDGHPVVQTPYLNRIALQGARFSRAYVACPTCIAARASLLTGLTPRTHGRVGYQDGVAWNYPVTLASEFTRQGYQTQAIGKMHVYPERNRVGFEHVILHDGFLHFAHNRHPADYDMVDDYQPWLRQQLGRDANDFEHGMNCNSFTVRPWDKPEHTHPTNYVVTHGIDFLRRRDPTKPFLLFLSFHRPHPPFDPPAWAYELYRDREMPSPPVGGWSRMFAKWENPEDPELWYGDMGRERLRNALAGYYAHITHIDHQINRFCETLQMFGLTRNSYICFVSDHGELLGDHNLFRKSFPYEGCARVPLILKGPDHCGIRANHISNRVVELRDIMPTLLECAGLEIPDGVEGRSFLANARGEDREVHPYLHGEHLVPCGGSAHYLTDGHAKYVWFSADGHEQLFDLDRDPRELQDLAGKANSAAGLKEWRCRLVKELGGREEGFTDGRKLIAGQPVYSVLKKGS